MTVTKWLTLVRQCLLRRISLQEFGDLLQTYPGEIDGRRLFAALIECRESFCASGDPLVSLYLDHVGISGIVKVSDALLVLINRWNEAKSSRAQGLFDCYNQTLQDITMIVVSPKYKATTSEARLALLLSVRWLSSLARQASNQPEVSSTPGSDHVLESLAFLVASMAATDGGLEALADPERSKIDTKEASGQQLRTLLRQALELCLPLYPVLSGQLMERLNTVLKHVSLLDAGSSQTAESSTQSSDMQALQFQVSIPDTQIVASKAATTLYLETMVS